MSLQKKLFVFYYETDISNFFVFYQIIVVKLKKIFFEQLNSNKSVLSLGDPFCDWKFYFKKKVAGFIFPYLFACLDFVFLSELFQVSVKFIESEKHIIKSFIQSQL